MRHSVRAMRSGRWVLSLVGLVLVVAALASGCAKAQAKSAPAGPPLDVPPPPPRVLAPVEEPVIAVEPTPELPPAAAPPRTPPPRPPVRRAEEPRPEQPAPAAAAPEPPPPAEPRELRPASP